MENKHTPFNTDEGRNFPEDYQQENGNYMNKCVYCNNHFRGNKHRNSCKLCDAGSLEFFTVVSKTKKPEDNKCAHAGCWSQGEMVGYAHCMIERYFPLKQQLSDLQVENERLKEENKKLVEIEDCNRRTWLNERQAFAEEKENLMSVMVAAAEEIKEHWPAHCDEDGYGPANLMHRLEKGIAANYPGYKPGAFNELREENERLKASNRKLVEWLDAAQCELKKLKQS